MDETPQNIALQFVSAINSCDSRILARWMTEDHTFVDADGSRHSGRDEMEGGWAGYYAMVPDFHIEVEDIMSVGNVVGMFGTAEGTFADHGRLLPQNHWKVTAAWRAVVEAGRIALWQLYVDPVPMLEIKNRIDASVSGNES